MNGIGRLLQVATERSAPTYWRDGIAELARRRALIEQQLAAGELSAYGFTTRLGQRDDEPSADDLAMLSEHLVGVEREMPDMVARLCLAHLMEQVLVSPSGAPPTAAERLLEVLDSDEPLTLRGAWFSSYGSGDVVPAAWLVHGALGRQHLTGAPGTTISLINGRHMSTAIATVSIAWTLGTIARCLGALANGTRELGGVLPSPLEGTDRAGERIPQLPVSLRDLSPTLSAARRAARSARSALLHRITTPSGNPLFEIDGDTVSAKSQSSFLDFELTMALQDVCCALLVAASCFHRLHVYRGTHNPDQPLQLPKILHAELDALTMSLPKPGAFGADDSAGVEDLRDLSLLTAAGLARGTRHLDVMLSVDGAAHGTPEDLSLLDSTLLGEDLGLGSAPAEHVARLIHEGGLWMSEFS